MMVKQSYTVRFTTPAFLGDAEQNGAWRTPPFKALLRQWWRVAAAKENSGELRKIEGELFGNAADKDSCKSKVRLRLENWNRGELNQLPSTSELICHNEVDLSNLPPNVRQHYYCTKHNSYHRVAASLYLGFGPIGTRGIRKAITSESDISTGDQKNKLLLLVPNEQNEKFKDVIQLIQWFGTIGGRSRNGWGSLLLEGNELNGLEILNQSDLLLKRLAKPLEKCLYLDWPHAFGKDSKGLLIWKLKQTHNTWREVMVELAKIKIAFRTALRFDLNRHHQIDKRHVLAYPVTHHNFNPWGNQSRLANQIRFKVTKTAQGYIGVAYHLPCSIPNELLNVLSAVDRTWIVGHQLSVWQKVHGILDEQMQRI